MALSTISGTTGITDATITSAKLADFSAAVDLNGVELILDADQDTSITADTDDRIDFKIAGVEHISISNSSGDTIIKPMVDAKDIVFQQYDGNKILEINDGNYVAISGAAAGPGELRFYEDTDNGTHYTGFKSGNNTESIAYVLPLADGTDGYQLTTDGSGTLTWAAGGAALTGSTNNTITTVTAANAFQGEANLTFDGSTLAVTGAATVSTTLGVTGILTGSAAIIGTTVEPTGDTAANDNAAIGYTSAEGLILTGQGSTNDVTIKNDADADVISIPTGTTGVTFAGTIGSGAITSTGIVTGTAFTAGSAVLAEAELELLDGLTAGTAIASKVVTTDASIDTTGQRNLTISGEIDAATGDFSGAVDVAGALTNATVAVNVAGKQTIWVPANAMNPTASNGCAAIATAETTSGRPDLQVLDFDDASDEHAQFSVAFPKSWNLGTVTFQAFWTSTATDTDGVAWGLQGVAVSNDGTIDVVYGTAIVVTDDNISAAEDCLVTSESSAITIAGTPADDDLCCFRVFRDISDGNDGMTEDARLIGIKLFFTTDAKNDA